MFDELYENIGGKIKNCAKWIFVIGLISSILIGIVVLAALGVEYGWWGHLVIVLCPIFSLVGSWILYAFGEMVEDVHEMRNKYLLLAKKTAICEVEEKDKKATDNAPKLREFVIPLYNKKHKCYECPSCGCTLKKGQSVCLCSKGLDWSNID